MTVWLLFSTDMDYHSALIEVFASRECADDYYQEHTDDFPNGAKIEEWSVIGVS